MVVTHDHLGRHVGRCVTRDRQHLTFDAVDFVIEQPVEFGVVRGRVSLRRFDQPLLMFKTMTGSPGSDRRSDAAPTWLPPARVRAKKSYRWFHTTIDLRPREDASSRLE